MARRMIWYSVGLIVFGFAGGLWLRHGWLSFALYHIGGLGTAGLLASIAAAIAARKGRGFWRAWWPAFLVPLLVGLAAAYLVPPGEHQTRPGPCGGSVSLALGLIFIVIWAVVRPRRDANSS